MGSSSIEPWNGQHPYSPVDKRLTAIRMVKTENGFKGFPEITFETIADVKVVHDDIHEVESESEYYFYIEHEVQMETSLVHFRLNWPDVAVAHVLCEKEEIPFRREESGLCFSIDLQGLQGRSVTLDVHTDFREPGLFLRLEQNDPLRVAGKYRDMPWPQMQIDAAIHYMYAAKEVAIGLDLPAQLSEQGLGRVTVLGFETNNAHHGDFPPHWHVIYHWPDWAGSQAPHLYMDESGKNTTNKVTVDGVPRVKTIYEAEEWCRLKDPYGRDGFALMITADGGVALAKPGSPIYRLAPYDPEDGVAVYVDGEQIARVKVRNDTSRGFLHIRWNRLSAAYPIEDSYEETITYNPLTGAVVASQRTNEVRG